MIQMTMISEPMVTACISSIHFHTLVKKPSKPFAQLNNEERFKDQSGLE